MQQFAGMEVIWELVCQKQVSMAGTSNYIPQYLWDVITCPFPWYLLAAHTDDMKTCMPEAGVKGREK